MAKAQKENAGQVGITLPPMNLQVLKITVVGDSPLISHRWSEKAKEMMLSGKYKLYEISHRVGYKNNAYFSQQFKKYTGKSPSEYC